MIQKQQNILRAANVIFVISKFIQAILFKMLLRLIRHPFIVKTTLIILYKSGLFQQNKVDMCSLYQKYRATLLKCIPMFAIANNMWLGDIHAELQGLTNPEQKLMSLSS